MILTFSGTKDGKELVYRLLDNGYNVTVSTATDYGGSLYEHADNLSIYSHRLNKAQMINFIEKVNPKIIIDASHPYATELKSTIIDCVKTIDKEIELLRFERKASTIDSIKDKITYVDTYEEAGDTACDLVGNVLLTTGSKTLKVFTDRIEIQRLIARILPKWEQVKACEDLGIKPSNIIAMQGPFNKAINKEMIDKHNAKILITKESGSVGGTMDKISAALENDVKVILIRRPKERNEYKYFDEINLVVDEVGNLYD